MKVDIIISDIYDNASLRNFFFRTQAENTFEELCERANDLNELFSVSAKSISRNAKKIDYC